MIRQRAFAGPLTILIALAPSTQACKAPRAFGDRHSIIVRADSALWSDVDTEFMEAIERRVFTTRPERTFKVTFVASNDTLWRDLRLWQQVVLLGSHGDEVVRRVLGASAEPNAAAPAIVQARDIWARGQIVTLLLLPPEGEADAVGALLSELHALLVDQYDEWTRERMYVSGVDDSLAAELAALGFRLDVPAVYRLTREDSVFRFRNAFPDPGTLLRSLLVTWEVGAGGAVADSLLAWREEIDETRYDPPQYILDEGLRFDTLDVAGVRGMELRGVWQDRSDFPAAGPFIARALYCAGQNRTYYMDAWLYAPSQDKYPYVRQLEVMLDSFRCAG